jgi:GTP pyrophosphokinase
MENLRIELFQDEVFVFTPKGDLFKLPVGSTPVDFAFAVHTNIGMHCLGAKVGGKIVPLNYKLHSGDSVEIITGANQKPNQDWIKFVRTSKARSKIKKWIKESMVEQSQKLGEEILQRQLKQANLKKDEIDLKAIAKSFGYNDIADLFSALGHGDVSAQQVINRLAPEKPEAEKKDESFIKKFLNRARGSAKGVRVQGIDNLLIHFGKCCQPVPGDRILGFVTQGQGVVIHRSDCRNILKHMENPERNIEVEWDVDADQSKRFIVRLHMLGEDRKHFLRDVSESISQTDTNIVSVEMRAQDAMVHSNIIVEVENLQHLTRVINKISKVKGVITVERLDGANERVPEA